MCKACHALRCMQPVTQAVGGALERAVDALRCDIGSTAVL